VVRRTYDALDRVVFIDYPDNSLDTFYLYDTGTFGKGRLAAIRRQATEVAYAYDRFGRVLQDGDLRYHYDPNGNRTEVEYPGGVIAQYAFDALDRPESLNLSTGGSVQAVATSATYYPGGPLAGLTLGNGLVETRSYDARYFPTAIQLGDKLHWTYTTDPEGNILQIADALNAAQTKTYSYQDYQYYLTLGNGPWGNLSWTYDPLGNRLTETRDGATDQYTYQLNATGGRTAKLVEVAPPTATATQILYDAIGSQAYESTGPDKVIRSFDVAGRMAQEIRGADPAGSPMSRFVYDGRSYLRRAEYLPTAARGEVTRETTAVYSSEGVLHQRLVETRTGVEDERGFVGDTERVSILYFGSRPVGQFEQDGDGERLRFLTVDHLGTPVAITEGAGDLGWAGGFEPFGADYGGAGEGGVFLRFPGQWGISDANGTYNLHRWFVLRLGRYSRPDPYGLSEDEENLYRYAKAVPITESDPLGLFTVEAGAPTCLRRYVEEELPKLRSNPLITANLARIGGAPIMDVQSALQWGKGPKIVLRNIPQPSGSIQFGRTRKRNPKEVEIHRPFVEKLCACPCDKGLVGMGVAILHELAHYLHASYRGLEPANFEAGDAFEKATYNDSVTFLTYFYAACKGLP